MSGSGKQGANIVWSDSGVLPANLSSIFSDAVSLPMRDEKRKGEGAAINVVAHNQKGGLSHG
jgi:hypothetical protein